MSVNLFLSFYFLSLVLQVLKLIRVTFIEKKYILYKIVYNQIKGV